MPVSVSGGGGFMDMGRNNILDRDRIDCCAAGEGFCRSADLGGTSGFGGVCGRMGTASPTSVWPRAFSTLGRLKRLNSESFDGALASLGVMF